MARKATKRRATPIKATLYTVPLDENSIELVNGQDLKAHVQKVMSLSEDELRGCTVNLAGALRHLQYQLEPHGIAVELGRVGVIDPEVQAFLEARGRA